MQSEKHWNKILGDPLNLYPALFSAAQPAHPACYRSTPAQPAYHFDYFSPHLPEWCGCPISPHLALSMDAAQIVPDGLSGQAYADSMSRATEPKASSAIIRFPRRDSRDSTLLPSPRPRNRLRRHRPGHSVFQRRPPVAPAKPTSHNRDGQQTGSGSTPDSIESRPLPGPRQVRTAEGRHRSNGLHGIHVSAGLPVRKGKPIRHREDRPKSLAITPPKTLPPEWCGFSARHTPLIPTRSHQSL